MRVLGLGYATPYLRRFLAEAERVAALMPAWLKVCCIGRRKGPIAWF